jgi:GH25 family lysozyme M1 (1,4-beta-N-acetylmuramidase)
MKTTTSRRWRRSLTAAITVSAGALLVGASTIPATAAQNPLPDPASLLSNPAALLADPGKLVQDRNRDHTLGSVIALVEGGGTAKNPLVPQASVPGIDVASYQGNVAWAAQWNAGRRFAYVKATEGTGYKNPYHTQQYNGSYNVGMIRGSYHFALPDVSSGAAQANYFVASGGGWSRDGRTLPGALDMEYNPYGATCYGKSKAAMTAWIKDFHDTYRAKTGRYPVIYTSTNWWNQCVGADFGSTAPLWVARYASAVGALPVGWGVHTIWQYSSTPLDQNSFNGVYSRLQALANG